MGKLIVAQHTRIEAGREVMRADAKVLSDRLHDLNILGFNRAYCANNRDSRETVDIFRTNFSRHFLLTEYAKELDETDSIVPYLDTEIVPNIKKATLLVMVAPLVAMAIAHHLDPRAHLLTDYPDLQERATLYEFDNLTSERIRSTPIE